MMGTRTTVMAPVGPLTCTRLPPKTAATAPATIAVTSPAVAPMPELTPKPSARGRATRPTITPAVRSREGRAWAQSDRRGSSILARARRPGCLPGHLAHERVAGVSSASSSPCTAMMPERMLRAARSRSRTSGTLTE